MSTLFAKIIRREIPADIVYEDDRALAFRDIHPAAPTHLLVIPKEPIVNIGSMTEEQTALVGHLTDFRVVTNSGAGAGQSVFHLHFHVLGGRRLGWPPG